MSGIQPNIRVVVMDDDFYARQAMVSYLAWDRRTRVTNAANSPEQLMNILQSYDKSLLPDVILLDTEYIHDSSDLGKVLTQINKISNELKIACISQSGNVDLAIIAAKMGASAFLVKNEVRLGLASAVVHVMDNGFVVTEAIFEQLIARKTKVAKDIKVLPGPVHYPELTKRMEQALRLYAVEGMTAELAADEMGISESTIRTFLRQATEVMQSYDERIYFSSTTARERLFQQYSKLSDDRPKDISS